MVIRGNEGVGVYLHERGYVVEHYRLADTHDKAIVIYRSSPFATRKDASDHAGQYREKQERE